VSNFRGGDLLRATFFSAIIRSRTPCLRLDGLGEPAGPGKARPANVFWCILGINLHLFECLNDKEFPVSVLC